MILTETVFLLKNDGKRLINCHRRDELFADPTGKLSALHRDTICWMGLHVPSTISRLLQAL
jgi:hypothetical protein